MKVITWNVNQVMSYERAQGTARWLRDQKADVLLLQEVACGRDEVFEDILGPTHHWKYGRHRGSELLYATGIAVSRDHDVTFESPLADNCRDLAVAAHSPTLGAVASVHVPNGSGWGWDKIKVWRQPQTWVTRGAANIILGGDFNAPALEGGTKTYCFGYRCVTKNGRKAMSPSIAAELRQAGTLDIEEDYWGAWDLENHPEGTDGTGKAWEEAEAWIYNRTQEHRLADAYRTTPSKYADDLQFSHYVRGSIRMRYDHVFVRGYTAERAGYLRQHIRKHASEVAPPGREVGGVPDHEREPVPAKYDDPAYRASDHAPLVVELRR